MKKEFLNIFTACIAVIAVVIVCEMCFFEKEHIVSDDGIGWAVEEDHEEEYEAFVDDFENGLDTSWNYEIPRESSFGIVEDPTSAENNAALFVLYDYDRNVNSGLRSEISRYAGSEEGSEEWYSWRFMLGPSHNNNSQWEILGQWHQQPAPGKNWNNAEYYINSTPILAVEYHDGKVNLNATNKKYGVEGIYSMEYPVTIGNWHNIRLHMKWSEGSEGFIEGWIDDVQIDFNPDEIYDDMIKLDGHRLYYPTLMNASGNYVKIGAYRNRMNPIGKSKVYYDDVRIFRKKLSEEN